MTPAYLNPPPPSPFPFVELKEDHEQQLHQFFNPPHQPSSSSSLSCPIFFNITQDQRGSHPREPQQKAEKYILNGGSSDREVIPSSSFQSTVVDTNNGHKLSYYKLDQDEDGDKRDSGAAKWMSSKMRLMKKMMSSDCKETNKNVRIVQKFRDQHQNNSTDHETDSPNNSNNFIRVCADCNTTKTPLWRSGPQGPKSLCNACGIRQRKARRAMAAAGGATNRAVLATDTSSTRAKLQNKEKKSRTSYIAQYKKPFKLPSGHPQNGKKKLSFEDFALSLSKNSAFQRVFPKDEEEAAILLMALSCGLIHS